MVDCDFMGKKIGDVKHLPKIHGVSDYGKSRDRKKRPKSQCSETAISVLLIFIISTIKKCTYIPVHLCRHF